MVTMMATDVCVCVLRKCAAGQGGRVCVWLMKHAGAVQLVGM